MIRVLSCSSLMGGGWSGGSAISQLSTPSPPSASTALDCCTHEREYLDGVSGSPEPLDRERLERECLLPLELHQELKALQSSSLLEVSRHLSSLASWALDEGLGVVRPASDRGEEGPGSGEGSGAGGDLGDAGELAEGEHDQTGV